MKRAWIILFILAFTVSCIFSANENISTYKIYPKTFQNSLFVDGFVEPVKSTSVIVPRNINGTISFLVEDGTFVKQGDVLVLIENAQIQTYYDEQVLFLENAKAGINKTKADLKSQYALLSAQIENNEADTKIAQLDSSQLDFYTQNQRKIKELELDKARIVKAKFSKKLKALAFIQQSEIRKAELEIQQTENNVKSIKDRLDGLTLRSPIDGLVILGTSRMTRNKFKVGDNVWGNMVVVTLPELNNMKIKIEATEREFKGMNVNDSVSYTFDAMPGNIGNGKIKMKMPVGKEYKEGSKVKFFEIEASLDSIKVMPEPGFTANCNIVLSEVKDTIVIPQVAVFESDSIKVVYVKEKNGYEMRQILTGISSPKETVIVAGLKINEEIALTKPSDKEIKGSKRLSDTIIKQK